MEIIELSEAENAAIRKVLEGVVGMKRQYADMSLNLRKMEAGIFEREARIRKIVEDKVQLANIEGSTGEYSYNLEKGVIEVATTENVPEMVEKEV